MNKRVEEIHNAYKANKRGIKKLIVEFFTEELKDIYWRNMRMPNNIRFEKETEYGCNEYVITAMYLDSDFNEPVFLVDSEYEKYLESFSVRTLIDIMLDYDEYGYKDTEERKDFWNK